MAEAFVLVVLQRMASTLGGGALKVLASQLGKNAPVLSEIENSMGQLQREFTVMQAFINEVRIRPSGNTAYDAWLAELKNVAHSAADVIDENEYLIAKETETNSFTRKFLHRLKNRKKWYGIAEQLKQIEATLQNLHNMKDRYCISFLEQGETSKQIHENKRDIILDAAYFDTKDGMVGNKGELAWLIEQVIHGKKIRTVISICGMGGLGKTFLAREIFKKDEVNTTFDCYAWISISQSYRVVDLLRRILQQLLEKAGMLCSHIDTMDRVKLVEKIRTYLQDKRYLILLDDMWSRDAWELLDCALVENNKGSRVIVTTRDLDVSSIADDGHRLMLEPLEREESWDLFTRKAFPVAEGRMCPQSIKPLAEEIVSKCHGLPLALVAIGSLLSNINEGEWMSFYKALDWHLNNNEKLQFVTSILKLSISYLPGNLKNCFLYCGLFPEDDILKRKQLIRLWIAEGFVEERGGQITLEETAEDHLKELIQRSLLQVVERNACGRAKLFQMHDLVREIVIRNCKLDKFSVLLNDPQVTKFGNEACRVSVVNKGMSIEVGVGAEKIRSFMLFDREVAHSWVEKASANFRLLRVLSLRFANIEKLPDVVTDLFNLHYLDLLCTKVKEIPKSLGRLRKLQLLDLRKTDVVELPHEMKALTKLRYLRTAVMLDSSTRIFDCFQAARLHYNISHLKDLQVLGDIEANSDLVSNLGKLTLLRSLIIMKVRSEHVEDLCSSIGRMYSLARLGVVAYDVDEVLNLEHLGHIPNLAKLHLQGKLRGGVAPSILHSFTKVRDLHMGWSGLQMDPLPSFSHMLNLTRLRLYRAYDGQILTFKAGWFPKLKELRLADMEQLRFIEVEAGTMQNLNLLLIRGLRDMLVVPSGFRYLTTVQKMLVWDMPQGFVERAQGDDFVLLKHINDIRYR